MKGSVELLSISGHLDSREPIVKPTLEVGLNFDKGGSIYGERRKIVKLDNKRRSGKTD